ncbi:bifunctional UDP-N-acetylglucosamine diphosphorylase/glucosamine-1-phosphate N-acetyltransferase GlmU [uncultured Abyssibacter sp.]|uniref:bifunctional UDP-N-acetylglucosamine diphosphorylase/glucosamine-1-phosphate N-acetyltransferase GlmU n=1 Tax=uncultured Abyssibacter sp. TaxID=2320202 RepID=UPI0032B2F0DA
MNQSKLHIVILAAGRGTRMRSSQPKVLQPLGGRPLLAHVLATARSLKPAATHVVIGHGADAVRARFADVSVNWVLQTEQRGTGHAVQQALPEIPDDARVLVLYGDVPLLTQDTLLTLIDVDGPALLSVVLPDPTGYGRIVRDEDGAVSAIVEHKDANPEQLAIDETNTGVLAARADRLKGWLSRVGSDNAQGEVYLTDVVGLAVEDGLTVEVVQATDPDEVAGVNDRRQLAAAERVLQRRAANALLDAGVTLIDPARFDQRGRMSVGEDVVIDVNVVFEGDVELGDGVEIGPNCVIRDARIGDGSVIHANTVIEDADIGPSCQIGPFARLRPGTVLVGDNRIGNFVETKKATLDQGAKAGHLAYLGDASIGKRVNVSAGVITCNYDGANKHRTVVGDDAFLGTDSQLVAPVTIGARAYIAAGSTITRNAPDDALTICRARGQKTIPGWRKPVKDSGK